MNLFNFKICPKFKNQPFLFIEYRGILLFAIQILFYLFFICSEMKTKNLLFALGKFYILSLFL